MRFWCGLLLFAGFAVADGSEASRLNWRLHLAPDREKIVIAHRLGEICDPVSVYYLVDLSESKKASVRQASIDALVNFLALPYSRINPAETAGRRLREMGSEAMPALIRALDVKRPRLAKGAAELVGYMGAPVDTALLLKLMTAPVTPYPRHEHTVGYDVEMARQAAATALIQLQATMVVGPELVKWLASPSPSERNIAMDGFEELSYPPALPALIGMHSEEQPVWIARAHQHDPAALARGLNLIGPSSKDVKAGIEILGAEGSQTARDALAATHFAPFFQNEAGAALLRWNDSRGWDPFLSAPNHDDLWHLSPVNRQYAISELSRRAKTNATAAQYLRYFVPPHTPTSIPTNATETVLLDVQRRMIKEFNGDPVVAEQIWQPLVVQAIEALRRRFTPQSVDVASWQAAPYPTQSHLRAECQRLPGEGGAILLSLAFPMLYSQDPAKGIIERNPILQVLFWQAHGRVLHQNVTRLFQADASGQPFWPFMRQSRQSGSEILFVGSAYLPALKRDYMDRYWAVADLFRLEGDHWISGGRWQRNGQFATATAIKQDGHLALKVEDRNVTGRGHPFTHPYTLRVRQGRLQATSPDPRLDPVSLLYRGIVDGEGGNLHLLTDALSSKSKAMEALNAVTEPEKGGYQEDGWISRLNLESDRATVRLFEYKPIDGSEGLKRRLLAFNFRRVAGYWKIVDFSSTEIPFSVDPWTS